LGTSSNSWDDPMINIDHIDRTVHRFQPEPLNSVKTATIQVFLVDRQERLGGVWDKFRNWIAAPM
jgi:hypothetical protein